MYIIFPFDITLSARFLSNIQFLSAFFPSTVCTRARTYRKRSSPTRVDMHDFRLVFSRSEPIKGNVLKSTRGFWDARSSAPVFPHAKRHNCKRVLGTECSLRTWKWNRRCRWSKSSRNRSSPLAPCALSWAARPRTLATSRTAVRLCRQKSQNVNNARPMHDQRTINARPLHDQCTTTARPMHARPCPVLHRLVPKTRLRGPIRSPFGVSGCRKGFFTVTATRAVTE